MAVQFPNFLQAGVRTPDYSGIGDAFQNYYAGRAMPKDDLIKAVQAQFARPNAEQSLLSSKLSNRKSQVELNKMIHEMAEQAAFEKQLRQALGGASSGGVAATENAPAMNMGSGGMPSMAPPVGISAPQSMPVNPAALRNAFSGASAQGAPMDNNLIGDGIDPAKMDARYRKFDQMGTGLPDSAYKGASVPGGGMPQASMAAPQGMPQTTAPQEQPNEIVVSRGSPHLAGVDEMFENNPLSRAFLEKKGYKKQQEIKFDNKTGRTTIMTKYPSGKVTLQTLGGEAAGRGEGIPLTSKMASKHQNIIASVDVALPVLKDLAKMGSYPRQSLYRGGQYADYEGKVSAAIDSVMGAFGLPMTNEGLKTIRDQVEIKTFETPSHYKARMEKLISDLEKRKNYSATEIKRSNKITPIGSSEDTNSGDGDISNMSDDDLRDIANA